MNPFIKTQYLTAQYEYLHNNDYIIRGQKNSGPYYSDEVYIIKKDLDLSKERIGSLPKLTINDFLILTNQRMPNLVERNGKDNILIDFYIKFYNDNNSIKSDVLKFFTNLTGLNLNIEYKKIFPLLLKNKEEIITTISDFPNKVLNFNTHEELKAFKGFLDENGLTEKENKDLFFNFFSVRKSFFKDAIYSTMVKNFLMYLYQDTPDELSKYFSFIPLLKNKFIEKDNQDNIFEKKYNLITSDINCQTMMNNYSIDNFTRLSYKEMIKNLSIAFSEYYKCKDVEFYELTSFPEITRVIIRHENKISEKLFEDKILEHSHFMILNPNYPKSSEMIKKWLFQSDLNKNLTDTSRHVNKNKI